MEEGTLSFVADHEIWKAVYRSKVRPSDDVDKFVAFASVIDKEAHRKVKDFLIEKGVSEKTLSESVSKISEMISFSRSEAKKTVDADRSLRALASAWAVREALKNKKIPYEYKKGKIKKLLKEL